MSAERAGGRPWELHGEHYPDGVIPLFWQRAALDVATAENEARSVLHERASRG